MSEEQKIQVHTKTGMVYTTCYKPLFEREKSNPISEVVRLDNMEFMAAFPDKFFDLAIVDPPYGINRSKNFGMAEFRWKQHNRSGWDALIPSKEYFTELERVSKNQIVWGGNYFVEYLKPKMGWIFWDKMQTDFSTSDGELAYTSFDCKLRRINLSRGKALANNGGTTIHPTQKPKLLYRWCLDKYGKQGQKILDTHLGSQSSRVAAWEMGFDFWGCEIDEQYFNEGNKRFENETMQTALWVG